MNCKKNSFTKFNSIYATDFNFLPEFVLAIFLFLFTKGTVFIVSHVLLGLLFAWIYNNYAINIDSCIVHSLKCHMDFGKVLKLMNMLSTELSIKWDFSC